MRCVLILGAVVIATTGLPISEKKSFIENTFGIIGEFGEYFEGDMVLTPKQKQAITAAMDARNGLKGGAKRWPNRTVIYHIEEDDFDEDQIKIIENGMADIANNSCIHFQERKNGEHAVVIQGNANGCFSNVGFSSPEDDGEIEQVLNLAKGCFKHGTVVHEMLHTIGFYHMQSTYDRDDYVKIIWENIKAVKVFAKNGVFVATDDGDSQSNNWEALRLDYLDKKCITINLDNSGTEHNFAKYNNDTVTDFGVVYDYESVMHYPEKAFSKNGNKTIIPLQENVTIGQRDGLSKSDIIKLNKMYCEELEENN